MDAGGFFFFSSRRRHTRYWRDWSSDVCSSDLRRQGPAHRLVAAARLRREAASRGRGVDGRRGARLRGARCDRRGGRPGLCRSGRDPERHLGRRRGGAAAGDSRKPACGGRSWPARHGRTRPRAARGRLRRRRECPLPAFDRDGALPRALRPAPDADAWTPAFAVGHDVPPDGSFGDDWIGWTPYSYPFNLTLQPAATVPCGLTAAGLPVGLQIVGPMHRDDLVLRASRAFEAIRPWPTIAAPRALTAS